MRKWELAEGHYKELCEKFPSNEDAKERLRRAQSRLAEARAGIFDIGKLYELREKGEMDIDVADFLGPIEVVDIPGKGKRASGNVNLTRKGFVATEDVRKGTLLMVSKAFAIVDVSSTEAIAHAEKIAHAVADKLQLRPDVAVEINALYDGNERIPGAPTDEGIPSIERLIRICEFGWGRCGKLRGLWILPSYFNYSCLTTAYANIYGDVVTFHAVTDLKRGDEITINGIGDLFHPYKFRERVYSAYGFTCSCRLCELDRTDPRYEERQDIVEVALMRHALMLRMLGPTGATDILIWTLEQLRETYANRTELRTQMYEPLYSLAADYMLIGSKDGYEMALKHLVEITQCLNERLLSEVGPCVYARMAQCYDNMNDEANARKYARMAADVDRNCMGSDDALFTKQYKKVAKFGHLL